MEQQPNINDNESGHENTVPNLDGTQGVPESERQEAVRDSLDNDTWRDQQ